MKLFELTGVNSQREKDMIQLLKDISGEGSKFKKVGDGVAAQVFVHESGVVYKFWAVDSAYEKFIEFVEKNSNNKHLPKLKSKVKLLHAFFKKPKDFPEKIKYVKMEQLEPIKHSTKMPGTRELYVTDIIHGIVNAIELGDDEGTFISELEADEGRDLSPEATRAITELFDLFKKMMKYPGMSKLNIDIHSGNIMMRGHDIVITDPVNSGKDTKFNKDLMAQIKQLHKDSDANS